MVGEDPVTIRAAAQRASGGEVHADFTAQSTVASVPYLEPMVTVIRRGQPVNASGTVIEAYRPGTDSAPLTVGLWITREEIEVVECNPSAGDDRWCAFGTGRFHTARLDHEAVTQHDACGVFSPDDACDVALARESGSIEFAIDGAWSVVSEQNNRAEYEFTPTLPLTPAMYEVTVTPSVEIRVLKRPANPVYAEEIVPCPSFSDPPCGAEFELTTRSDPSWNTSFTLWSVQPGWPDPGTSPPPLVRLGHDQRTEETHDFAFGVQPTGYVPLATEVVFREDGMDRHVTPGEMGPTTGAATLATDARFEHPEGIHEAFVSLNAGWYFNVGDVRVPMDIQSNPLEFPILMLDADVDSDNDNPWMEALDRDDEEDALERIDELASNPQGKIIFTNTDDSDNDGIPDYADLKTGPDLSTSYGAYGETAMVPMDVELRGTAAVVGATEVVFDYEGPEPGDFPLDPGTVTHLGAKGMHDYYDYTDRRRGRLRVWRGVADPGDQRTADDLLLSGLSYTAAELGFTPTNPVVRFWVEAVNGNTPSGAVTADVVSVEASVGAHPVNYDDVAFLVYDVNLGMNNSNSAPDRLRVGVPDVFWEVDAFDDAVEDQGDGFRMWRAPNGILATTQLELDHLEDFVPVEIHASPSLHFDQANARFGNGVEFMLAFFPHPNAASIPDYPQVIVDPTNSGGMSHLEDRVNGDLFIQRADGRPESLDGALRRASALSGVMTDYGRGGRLTELDTDESVNHLVMRFLDVEGLPVDTDSEMGMLRLMAKPAKMGGTSLSDDGWVVVDSARMTIKDASQWYSIWTARGDNDDWGDATVSRSYPVDGGVSVTTSAFPEAEHSSDSPASGLWATSGLPEPDVDQYIVWTHGYNVSYQSFVLESCPKLFKRLFWTGWRGNTVFYTWKGDVPNFMMFGFSNQNALRSSQPFRDFILDQVRGEWFVDPENISVVAHSLGNLVVWDALRVHAAESSGSLFGSLVSVEAAIPGEALWPYGPVTYCGGMPDDPQSSDFECLCTGINPLDASDNTDCTYSVDELECNSWSWWLNQPGQRAHDAVDWVVHSYAPSDGVLSGVMRLSDYAVRQIPSYYSDTIEGRFCDFDLSLYAQRYDDPNYNRKSATYCFLNQRRVPDPEVSGTFSDAPNLAYGSCDSPGSPFMMKRNRRVPSNDHADLLRFFPPFLTKTIPWWIDAIAAIYDVIDLYEGYRHLVLPLGNDELPVDDLGVPVVSDAVSVDATFWSWPQRSVLPPFTSEGFLFYNHSSHEVEPLVSIRPWFQELYYNSGFAYGRDHEAAK
jgi:hypothetical protein